MSTAPATRRGVCQPRLTHCLTAWTTSRKTRWRTGTFMLFVGALLGWLMPSSQAVAQGPVVGNPNLSIIDTSEPDPNWTQVELNDRRGAARPPGATMVAATGSLTIVKEAMPADGTDFAFSSDIPTRELGDISTVVGTGTFGFSGDGGPATNAQVWFPNGVAFDAMGNLFIADNRNHRIRKVDAATGDISTVVGTGPVGFEQGGFSGDGGPATSARLADPRDVAVDSVGNLFIVDFSNNRIRKVDASTGIISTVAGTGAVGFSGDGGPATSARLNFPSGVAVDSVGNLFIADVNNHRIRKVAAGTGIITTVAGTDTRGFSGDGGPATNAQLNFPSGVAVDSAGNLFIADAWNHRIRKVATDTGIISTVAGTGTFGFSGDGGLATSARLNFPGDVAVDSVGNLFIVDFSNNRIRKVDAGTGIISTVAGTGSQGFSGDGGPATAAQLGLPSGVAVDSVGNLFIADTSNHRIRKVATLPASFTLDVDSDPTYEDRITFNDLAADSYAITETLPADWQLDNASCTGGSDSGSLNGETLTVALGAGETVVCTFTNSQFPPDLQLSKSDGGLTAVPGGTISYTLDYTNVGGATATGVVITETVPTNTTFNAGASSAGWSCVPDGSAGSTCTLAVGAVAGSGGNGSATFAITVDSPIAAGVTQISNTASIGDDGSNGADPTPGDNTASETTLMAPNTAPTITSNGGGDTAAINVPENQTAVTDVQTSDDNDAENAGLTYSKTGGADQALFNLDVNTGVLTFITAPDFENPTDVGNDNVYDVQVTVTDSGSLTDTQAIAVTVTDTCVSVIATTFAQLRDAVTDYNNNCLDGETLTVDLDGNLIQYTNALPALNNETTAVLAIKDGTLDADGKGHVLLMSAGTATFDTTLLTGGTGPNGGAIQVEPNANVTLVNTTVTENSSITAAALLNNGGTMTLSNVTVSTNTISAANNSLGSIWNRINGANVPTLNLNNTIIANTIDTNGLAVPDCRNNAGTVNFSAGTSNLIEQDQAGGVACDLAGTNTLSGDPVLGPLQDNGGQSDTLALLAGSWAINAGDDAVCAASPVDGVDQRGIPRPQGTTCDIGAFEFDDLSSLTIVKQATPEDGTDFAFTSNIPGNGSFTLDDEASQTDSINQSITITDLVPGTYAITETLPSDWQLDNASCTGGSDSGSLSGATLAVALGTRENVTCTFTNSLQPGSLTIVKQALPADGTDFAFSSNVPGNPSFSLDDEASQTDSISQSITFANLVSGTYAITETLPADWQLDNASCTGASGNVSLTGGTLSIALGAAETVVCTFTNSSLDPGPISASVYLPLISKSFASGPDLVVDEVMVTANTVAVTIRNQGNAPVVDAFWVDLYLNPSKVPEVNEPWDTIASQGVAWGLVGNDLPIEPGQTRVLTLANAVPGEDLTSPPPYPVGATVYVLVDALDFSTTYGAVEESDETNNLAQSTVAAASSSDAPVQPVITSQTSALEALPLRR